ncbi:MAG: cytochrome c-type biogenesis protein CcmH, partial [Comamonadaceae bacterium]|nr:cytochrome c-type biogenesis protein CcmH [Comamonadaceae bacterium]
MAAIFFTAIACAQNAAPPAAGAPDPLADRMHRLTQDLRCLVCQNESLADSHAPLAMDLKREIRTLMAQGQSDAQIRDFLTQRYGDFVNYQPPLRAGTLLLWAGPLLMLGAGGWLVWRSVRASQRRPFAHGSPAGSHGDGATLGAGAAGGPDGAG